VTTDEIDAVAALQAGVRKAYADADAAIQTWQPQPCPSRPPRLAKAAASVAGDGT
jgi:hypothetical protein